MTAPVTMTHPVLNHNAFQEVLDTIKIKADTMEIRTRSEVQLVDAEAQLKKLTDEGVEIRTELEWIKQLETQLAQTRQTLEVNEVDNSIARRALLAQINVLRESGIEATAKKEGK